MLDSAGIEIIVMGLGVAAVLALLQYVISRQPPKELAGDHGVMHPNDSMIAVGIVIAAGVGGAGIFYHLVIANNLVAILIAVLSIVSIPIMATAFSSIYDITWDTDRITGPSTTWHSPFNTERREVPFEDMVAAGRDKWGNYFVESSDGTCIRWNWFYNGYPELMYFVEDICPHLFPDEVTPVADGLAQSAPDAASKTHSGIAGSEFPRFFAGRLENGRLALAVQLPTLGDVGSLFKGMAKSCFGWARRTPDQDPAEAIQAGIADTTEDERPSAS